MAAAAPARLSRLPQALGWFLGSWRFPTLVLALLVFWELLLLVFLLIPETEGALGAFTRDFRIWCFGFDPATGDFQPMYVVLMLTEPVALSATLLTVWWRPMRTLKMKAALPWIGAAALMVVVAGIGLGITARPEATLEGELPFPAERLRTAYTPPEFNLVDQEGAPLSLSDLQGKVVVLTAVYATCGFTCPMIMSQAKGAVSGLSPEEQADLVVVGVTLDPEHDTPEVLSRMAAGQDVQAPLFRLVTGDPEPVNTLLDELQIARSRDPQTGVIDHVNVFVVVDRAGRLAYRFSLGERQERWLESALRLLLRETGAHG